jgi:hypothetical protein
MPKAKAVRRKRCSECEELFEPDDLCDGRCEECDQHFTRCYICGEDQHEDSVCRHVFQSEETGWEWMGAGSYNGTDQPDEHRASFLAVLDWTGLADLLAVAIRNDSLETKYYGPMIGSASYWCWLRPEGAPHGWNYGERFTEDLDDDVMEELTIGVGWLDSIQYRPPGHPKGGAFLDDARAVTLRWIDEWRADPLRRIASAHARVAAMTCEYYDHDRPAWDDPAVLRLACGYGRAAREHFTDQHYDRRRR